MDTTADLQDRWTDLYRKTLPALAKSRDSAQPRWPVFLDHCFARIILDNAIGISKPWAEVLKAPAVKNMNTSQLIAAIELGEKIATGEVNLVELDERSLELRGKKSKTNGAKRKKSVGDVEPDESLTSFGTTGLSAKHQRLDTEAEDGTISKYFVSTPQKVVKHTPVSSASTKSHKRAKLEPRKEFKVVNTTEPSKPPTIAKFTSDQDPLLLISASDSLTTFRKEVLSVLAGVPKGHWTTYAAMSDYITRTSHKTCARAIGNAMRNNPFAPVVPCHRVLAADGSIGGFGGSWGESGEHAKEKVNLLRAEGVRFDGKGKAVGMPWKAWDDGK